jgi:hypothetical protein
MAERDFQSVDAVNGGVAGRSAAQGRDFGVWHKPHMHQVVLNILRQVEGNEHLAFTDRQITEQAHLTNPASLTEEAGSKEIRPYWSQFSIRPNCLRLQSGFLGDLWFGYSYDLTSWKGGSAGKQSTPPGLRQTFAQSIGTVAHLK